MSGEPARLVRATDGYRRDAELVFSPTAQDGRPDLFEFMDLDHCMIRRRFGAEWDQIEPMGAGVGDRFREHRDISATGQPFTCTVLGRKAADSSIELLSLTIEWLDGRAQSPPQ